MARNFSYILDGKLAGLERPGRYADLEDDLEFLKGQGISALVSLTEAPLETSALERMEMGYAHLPIPDFHPPTLQQIKNFISFMDEQIEAERAVAVHCGAGIGRTGTMLACALVKYEALTASEAIAKVRLLRPGSIETLEQEDSVWQYERALRRSDNAP